MVLISLFEQEYNKWKGSFLHLVFGVLLNAKVWLDHIQSLIKDCSLQKERAPFKETAAVMPVPSVLLKRKIIEQQRLWQKSLNDLGTLSDIF